MPEQEKKNKSAKGEFEEFKSSWLLQVAADKVSKAAAPAAMVLACQYLNRASGKAWPGINSLMAATGAASTNTIRSALKVLEERGHALIEWSDGGKNKTHIVTPLVNGKPFRKLKGMDDRNPSTSDRETLQETDAKPFKNLTPNHLKEPLDLQGAAQAAPHLGREKTSVGGGSVSADADRPLSAGDVEHEYSFVDLQEIERRDRAFATGPLPGFDGHEAPQPTSLDEYGEHAAEDELVAGQNRADEADLSTVRYRELVARCKQDADALAPAERSTIERVERKLDRCEILSDDEIYQITNTARVLDESDIDDLKSQPSEGEFRWGQKKTNEVTKEGSVP